jgi:hypothetical protein
MAIKPHINSLRCKQWYGFAKTKMLQLKNYDIPGKTYIINGYRIILKALMDLALIKAPAGLAIFRKAPGEIQIYYADMYGYGKEKAVEIQTLRGTDGEPPINPMDDGWPGNILALPIGGFDFIQLFFGARPDGAVESPSYFTVRSGFGLQALATAAYSIRYRKGFVHYVEDTSLPHVFPVVNVGSYFCYTEYGECRLYDSGFEYLQFGYGKNKPGANFPFDIWYIDEFKGYWPNGNTWTWCWTPYCYTWKHYDALKKRDVVRCCYLIQGGTYSFTRKGMTFLFADIDPEEAYPNDFVLKGYSTHTNVYTLYPYSELDYATDLEARDFVGAPTTQSSELTSIKNVVFPITNGALVFAQYNRGITSPDEPIFLVVDRGNTPYIHSGFNIPYIYDEFVNPFCVRVDETLPALYLYWEEAMRFGGEDTDIIRLKYGSPFASWIDFPFFDEGVRMTNFTPIKITWDHRILLATIYKELDPQEGGGMYTALLDTEKSSDWIIGQRFSETRLDRCSPTVFGEHPYVEERKKYGGTQWGWDYSYCRNYEEPPGGYPT